jgi:hypothetical protein
VITTTAIWLTNPGLIIALDDRFGEPTDCYVNGSQVWLRDDGPNDITFEWRLHPVAGYVKPKGVPTVDVFGQIALALGQGETDAVDPTTLWDGLEAFCAYNDEITAEVLRIHVVTALGIEPLAVGDVDHDKIGDAWEREEGRRSVIGDLRAQLDV